MSKRIVEKITRNCCEWDDLVVVPGHEPRHRIINPERMYCKHCREIHSLTRFMDAAGSSDYRYDPTGTFYRRKTKSSNTKTHR